MSTMLAPSALLTVREAARVVAVSPDTIYRRVASGELPVVHVGRLIRIHPDDLAALVVAAPGARSS